MTTALVAMVRDEADIVGPWIRHHAEQVDFMLVADNNSVDGTREILDKLSHEYPLTVLDDPEIGFYQSAKTSRLAAQAFEQGATWILPADCDEIWRAAGGERIADCLIRHEADWGIVQARLFDHVATGVDPSEEDEPDPTRRLQWRRAEPLELPKVACRAAEGLTIWQGNHGASYPVPARITHFYPLTVRHLPYRSVAQFIRKARNGAEAYRATEGLPAEAGAHWRKWGEMSDEQLGDVFRSWYWRANPGERIRIGRERQEPLVHDPVR